MRTLIIGHDQALLNWARAIYEPPGGEFRLPATTIGFMDEKAILAVAIYTNFSHHSCEISFVASDPRWATKANIRVVFEYPFRQLGVQRLTAITSKKNRRCRKLLEGVGFHMEGVHPYAYDGKQPAISYGMYAEEAEARWLHVIPKRLAA